MVTVWLSQYTDSEGKRVSTVLYGGCAMTAPSEDHSAHAQYARALYHNTHGPRRLVSWDGDTECTAVLEAAND